MQPLGRDPAPSRLAWRIERLLLTPGVRFCLRVVAPTLSVLALGALVLTRPDVQASLASAVDEARTRIEARPEFTIHALAIDGAPPELDRRIRELLPLRFPLSTFDLDLDAIRETLRDVPAVKSVAIHHEAGGILQLHIEPRVPVAIWRTTRGLQLVDATGAAIGPLAARSERSDLPVIAGEGAPIAVREALALIAVAAPLKDRLRGLVRVGERRWDAVLSDGPRILLPEFAAEQAFERVMVLHAVEGLLDRDLSAVDVRLQNRPTIRLSPQARDQLWDASSRDRNRE